MKFDRRASSYPAAYRQPAAGFALVFTMVITALLVVLVLAILSLATSSSRSERHRLAKVEAQGNARLALALAIGQLQSATGPDQAITAPAGHVHDAATQATLQPHLTGVWRSWRLNPNLSSPATEYPKKAAQFREWLVSSPAITDARRFAYPTETLPAGANQSVTLVGKPNPAQALPDRYPDNPATPENETKIFNPAPEIIVRPLALKAGERVSNLAWATFDESGKAPIHREDRVPAELSGELAKRAAPARPRADTLAPALAPLAATRNLHTLTTAELPLAAAEARQIRGRMHDFTTDSAGLLANVTEGGLKTDLTTLFESPAPVTPDASASPCDPAFLNDGTPRWDYLRDLYRQYKRTINKLSTGEPAMPLIPAETTPDSGFRNAPPQHRLLPVISKLQIVFSVVSHRAHIADHVGLVNNLTGGQNDAFAKPHFGFEPVVTLYNPYDVAISLKKLRIRIWDPPVGFKFKKDGQNSSGAIVHEYIRSEFNNANAFLGLVNFHSNADRNVAREYFTMFLTDPKGGTPGGATPAPGSEIVLLPGESRVFSAWVDPGWNWWMECNMPYPNWGWWWILPRAFFSACISQEMGNMDWRTRNPFGQEAVPGWRSQAGLRVDALGDGSNPNALYNWEKDPSNYRRGLPYLQRFANTPLPGVRAGEFTVECKPLRAIPAPYPDEPDFRVEILAGDSDSVKVDVGQNPKPPRAHDVFWWFWWEPWWMPDNSDILRRYDFRFPDVTAALAETPYQPVISRTFRVEDIHQDWMDTSPGGKSPFAILTMTVKTPRDAASDSKAWLYNNPVIEGSNMDTRSVGLANQSYDLKLVEVSGDADSAIKFEPGTNRGFFGAGTSADTGSTLVPMFHVPIQPMASLGELVHANLVAGSRLPPTGSTIAPLADARVTHALGNARAHPLVGATGVATSAAPRAVDHSYLLNDALWDRYYFSSITSYTCGFFTSPRDRRRVLEDFLNGSKPLLNSRLIPTPDARVGGSTRAATLTAAMDATSDMAANRRVAASLLTDGAFNVNSTSVDAWRAVLTSLRDQAVTGWQMKNKLAKDKALVPFARANLPHEGGEANPAAGDKDPVERQRRWAGFRTLNDAQINALAQSIVLEIRRRGIEDKAPSLSLGEFVNRRLGIPTATHVMAGLLQTAIDKSGVNTAFHALDSKTVTAAAIPADRRTGTRLPEALTGLTAEGAPSILTQGDLMQALAPIATTRGDTFKIRTYGEATDRAGNITARAWCEAVVQRLPAHVDPADPAESLPSAFRSPANTLFGRRYTITSIRWLSPEEI